MFVLVGNFRVLFSRNLSISLRFASRAYVKSCPLATKNDIIISPPWTNSLRSGMKYHAKCFTYNFVLSYDHLTSLFKK